MARRMSAEEKSAWVAAVVALLCTLTTVAIQIWAQIQSTKEKRQDEWMQRRREALMQALEVIDNVYAHSKWNNGLTTLGQEWEISTARKAMNGMIIYCKNPNRAVTSFSNAIGLSEHDPNLVKQEPLRFGPQGLAEFRNIVCEELELAPITYTDTNRVWIARLPGAK